MNTCETCQHWHRKKSGVRADGAAVGECRAHTPGRDFTWPRTAAKDYCSEHSATQVHYAQASQATVQATAGSLLSLDAGTSGDAPPAPAVDGDGGSGNRRRSRAKA
jgi:hypothetical protein